MKKYFTLIFSLLLVKNAFSQNQDSIKYMLESAVKMFTWDIEKAERGSLMFLDVAYQRDNQDSLEYLTLAVAKYKSQKRPAFISISLPNNILRSNGIFIQFAMTLKTAGGQGWKIALEKANPVRIHFEKCDDETCTARIVDGFAADEVTKEKIDIFQKCMDFDHIYFLFVFPDGSHKSVGVPLFSFKQQYNKL